MTKHLATGAAKAANPLTHSASLGLGAILLARCIFQGYEPNEMEWGIAAIAVGSLITTVGSTLRSKGWIE